MNDWQQQAYNRFAEQYQEKAQRALTAKSDRPGWADPDVSRGWYSDPERIAAHSAVVRYAQAKLHPTQRFVFIGQSDLVIFSSDPNWRDRLEKVLEWNRGH